jgi:hypothetical protein
MKTALRSGWSLAALLTLALAFVFACLPTASAQVAAPELTPALDVALDAAGAVAQPFIVSLAQSHPWLLTALAVIASLRLVFKPLMSAAHVFVQSTPSTSDDELLAKVEHSRSYKIAAWLLDYLGSIKVGPQRPQPQPNPAS